MLRNAVLVDSRDFVQSFFVNARQHQTAFVGRGRLSSTHRSSARVK